MPRWLKALSPQMVAVVGSLLVGSLLIGAGTTLALRPSALSPSLVAAPHRSPSPSPSPRAASTPTPTASPLTPSAPVNAETGRVRCGLVCRPADLEGAGPG